MASTNPFYDWLNLYGGTNPLNGAPQNWYNTPLVRDDLSQTMPQGEFERYLSTAGFGGFGNEDQWARSLYGRTQQGYQAAELNNPNLSYRDYLTGLGSDWLRTAYANLTPNQRGGGSQPGQTRWVSWG